jgi:hypothetical protein
MRPCFKKYLFRQVRSNFLFIDPNEWEKAILLPTERFKKAPKSRVWNESTASGNFTGKPTPPNRPVSESTVKPTKPTSILTTKFFKDDD